MLCYLYLLGIDSHRHHDSAYRPTNLRGSRRALHLSRRAIVCSTFNFHNLLITTIHCLHALVRGFVQIQVEYRFEAMLAIAMSIGRLWGYILYPSLDTLWMPHIHRANYITTESPLWALRCVCCVGGAFVVHVRLVWRARYLW